MWYWLSLFLDITTKQAKAGILHHHHDFLLPFQNKNPLLDILIWLYLQAIIGLLEFPYAAPRERLKPAGSRLRLICFLKYIWNENSFGFQRRILALLRDLIINPAFDAYQKRGVLQ